MSNDSQRTIQVLLQECRNIEEKNIALTKQLEQFKIENIDLKLTMEMQKVEISILKLKTLMDSVDEDILDKIIKQHICNE